MFNWIGIFQDMTNQISKDMIEKIVEYGANRYWVYLNVPEKDEIFGEFRKGGFSSNFTYLEFLKENTQIRIDNGQNIILVYIIFLIRFIKNIRKVLKK